VYLFVGCQLPIWADKFSRYDIDNPSKDDVAWIKKHFKRDRNAAKKFHLSGQYGAGPTTQHAALVLEEYEVELDEIKTANTKYWANVFPGVKDFSFRLLHEWHKNGGWIKSGLGLPIAVSDHKAFYATKFGEQPKDLLNCYCQHTGHTLLQRDLRYINKERWRRRLPMYPAIPDYHDESIWIIREDCAEEGKDLMRQSMVQVNEGLGWDVEIKGDPATSKNLAQIKCDDYDEWVDGRSK